MFFSQKKFLDKACAIFWRNDSCIFVNFLYFILWFYIFIDFFWQEILLFYDKAWPFFVNQGVASTRCDGKTEIYM